MSPRRVLFGALAALGTAAIALDKEIGQPDYPMFHRFFGADWAVAHNLSYSVFALMAAVFGYLALNAKDDDGRSRQHSSDPANRDRIQDAGDRDAGDRKRE